VRPAGRAVARRHTAGRLALGLALACTLAACADRDRDADRVADAGTAEASLPAPEDARGGVTGMPERPGPGRIGAPPPSDTVTPGQAGIDIQAGAPSPEQQAADAAGLEGQPPPATSGRATPPDDDDGPGADAALQVLDAYYEAINAGRHDRAYALWSGRGTASGQSPQQFADGFDDTREVEVELLAPGRIEAAAGSRYIQVPVAVRATRDDGSVHHYAGTYTLRRAVVDGASAEQRAWRIDAADLREVQP
jgi:hypothetical protein